MSAHWSRAMRLKQSHPSVQRNSRWRRHLWKQTLWRQQGSANSVTTIRYGQFEAGAEVWCRRCGTSCRVQPDGLPIRIGDSLDLKFPAVDDPESRICMFLTEYRDAVDRKHCEADCRKAAPQHRQDSLASLGVQPTRQCHVESEIFHDIGIAPAVEVLALPRRQLGRISPRAVLCPERRAERIEFACTIGGKPDEFGRRLRRDHRNKPADRTDDGSDD